MKNFNKNTKAVMLGVSLLALSATSSYYIQKLPVQVNEKIETNETNLELQKEALVSKRSGTARRSVEFGSTRLKEVEEKEEIEKLEVKEEIDKMSNDEVARLVIAGKYGNGDAREKKLTEEGYNYQDVSTLINEIERKNKAKSLELDKNSKIEDNKITEVAKANSKLTNNEVAKLVVAGKYGNGDSRKAKIEKEGYNYSDIKKEVNKLTYVVASNNSKSNAPTRGKVNRKEVIKTSTNNAQRSMKATAYSTSEPGLSRYTANGTDLHKNPRVVAVDPNVIPLGSTVEIEGYGTYIAADTGGAIKGNRIDIHFKTVKECINFGRRTVKVTVR